MVNAASRRPSSSLRYIKPVIEELEAPIIGSDIKIKEITANTLPCVKEKAGTANSPKELLYNVPTTNALRGPNTLSDNQLPTITNNELQAPIAAIILAASPCVKPSPLVYGLYK